MLVYESTGGRPEAATDSTQKADTQIQIEELSDSVDLDALPEDSKVSSIPIPVFDPNATHLISSPYTNLANQLQLQTLDTQSRLFALALTTLAPLRSDYATAPYMEAFNWPFVFEILRVLCQQTGIPWKSQDFHVVIFRSALRADADRVRLGELDQKSHEEACASGGLLRYWFGSTDAQRRNLATCLWVSREDAAAGGRGPWHKKARGAAREMYKTLSFHTHALVVEDDVSSWWLEGV